ncbi:hypothetical protein [Hymenobacter persicinus]|uniref:DUF922 domain-containing protein n=1 Tax=Hymenobacter persicinus TaxID=2025506 RepID=A0A4Q5LD04_9BACT|nr:hypothetical protein [Hymenobacter persicinus]RYU78103.1 hypothetical protein EWM57_15360 [Hymenobacter persicinus]
MRLFLAVSSFAQAVGCGLCRPGRVAGLLLLALLATAAQPAPAPLPPLVLQAPQLRLEPREFYVAALEDARPTPLAVAELWALPTAPAPGPGSLQQVDLQGGSLPALRRFVQQSLARNPALRPVTIRLTECRISEQPVAGAPGQVEGRVTVGMTFEWARNGQRLPLTTYRGAARYLRPARQLTVVEPTLRQALSEALNYLNTWMNQQARHNPVLARGVCLTLDDYTRNTDPDTLFYAPGRPLAVADFLGPTRPGHYAAAVFPSFAFSAQPTMEQGWLHLRVQVKVFVVRHSSWISATSRDAYTLNHEQRHFDLVKLVAERFKQKIQPANLTVEDYNATMQLAYFTSFQEMNRLQEQYDAETSNGSNSAAQQRWDQRISAELRALAPAR